MREYLTTSEIGREAGDLSSQQIRNLWNQGELPGDLLNPSGKHLRFKKTPALLEWCAEKRRRVRPRPIDHAQWVKLNERERQAEKVIGEVELSWSAAEIWEISRQKPARMNMDLWLKILSVERMEFEAARVTQRNPQQLRRAAALGQLINKSQIDQRIASLSSIHRQSNDLL